MKPLPINVLLAAGGLAIGLAAGYHLAGKSTPGQATAANGATSPAEGPTRGRSNPRAEAHDLSRLLRVMRRHATLGDPAALREMERMSTAELRALVEELTGSIPRGLSDDRQAISQLLEMAAREWFRRDGEEALRQADAMPAGDPRKWTLYRLMSAAARTEPTLAKAWAERLKEEFGRDLVHSIAHEAAMGAAGRSADDFLQVHELFQGIGVGLSSHTPFAENFDFRKVVAALPPGYEGSGAVVAWGARDPDAAWQATRELIVQHGKEAARYVTSIFHGISLVNDDTVAAAWLAEKIGEVPAEHRREVFQSLWSVESLQPERVTAVMGALTSPDDQREFAAALVGPYDERGYGSLALKAMASDVDRGQVLLESARRLAPGMEGREGTPHYQQMSGYFDKTMADVGVPDEMRERVRAALTNGE